MPSAGSSRSFQAALAWRYALFLMVFGLLVAALVVAEAVGLPRSWLGTGFLVATVAVYAGIGFLARTSSEAEYFVAGRRVPALYNGMATAADWMSAASFIGTAGVLYLQGFAGLAYILGWTGGYCLLALLLAPYLRRFGQYTVPDFLGARYGGRAPRLIGAVASIGVSFVYVVVQIYGVGLITSHLTGFGFELGIFVALGGVLVCSFLGGMRAVTWTQVAQYTVLIVAYLLPLTWLSIKQHGSPLPVWSYSQPLAAISAREQQLQNDPREQEVMRLWQQRAEATRRKLDDVPAAMAADAAAARAEIAALLERRAPLAQLQLAERDYALRPRTEADARRHYQQQRESALMQARPLAGMAPQTLPFPTGDPQGDAASRARYDTERINFVALVLCLMMGTAAMPHVLTRFYTTPTPSQARRSVAWTLLFVTLLYLAAPALAVLVKSEVLNHLVGMPFDALPAWVSRWSRLDPGLLSVQDINGDGILQLGELTIGGDMIVLAAPEIGGLPYWVTCLVAAGGLAAALSTADGLLLTIANAATHDIYYGVLARRATSARRVVASKMVVMGVAIGAALVAALKITDILQFVAAAFSFAASAFFPALVLGIFWRRANGAGAIAGMLSGLSVCAYYMASNLPVLRDWLAFGQLQDARWFGVDAIAAGVYAVPCGFGVMIAVSLLTAPPSAAQREVVDRMRFPQPGE